MQLSAGFFVQQTAVNTETHNWSECRAYVPVEPHKTYAPLQHLTPAKAQGPSCKGTEGVCPLVGGLCSSDGRAPTLSISGNLRLKLRLAYAEPSARRGIHAGVYGHLLVTVPQRSFRVGKRTEQFL